MQYGSTAQSTSTISFPVDLQQPFRQFNSNTSAMVRDALPSEIVRSDARPIRVTKHPQDIVCTFESCRSVIESIWSGRNPAISGHVDLVVYIGMRDWYPSYCFETMARRDRYYYK